MKIFITGHDGFIGTAMVQRLKDEHELFFLEHDLREHALVNAQLLEVDPDVVVHLAARTEVQESFVEQITFSEINYVGTVNLIETCRELTNLKNFVFASTMEVYGWQPFSDVIEAGEEDPANIPAFDELTLPNPNAPYAVAKYACEKYLEYAHRSYGLPFTAIRQTNAYGRTDNDYFVTEHIISQMLTSDTCKLGYAEPYRNFIHIDDLLDVWQLVIENPEQCNSDIFCIGPNNAIKIKDYADMIAAKLDWEGTIEWGTKPPRPGEIYLLNSVNTIVTSKLGWEPKISLSEGLDRTIAHWREKLQQNQ